MKHKGFTLIEFIVIISIFAIMASIALLNFNGFRSNISLSNLANDIGLTIRQAQVFGWANQSDTQNGGLGVALDGTDPLSGNPIRFPDGVYFNLANPKEITLYKKNTTATPPYFVDNVTDRVVDIVRVSGPNSISGIYAATNKADLLIDSDGLGGSAIALTEISVAFSRPKPEALFYVSGAPLAVGDYVGVYIKADTDTDPKHVIIISRTGEIDVQ